ncbi:MAG: peroxiredoxin [Psychroserpens sp.]|jgi:peroxiredoxin
MNFKIPILQLLLIQLAILLSCQSEEPIMVFELEGRSSLTIKNETGNSIKIGIENWYLLPWKSQEVDTVILEGASLYVDLITQGPTYYNLNIGDKEFKIFSKPNSADQIVVKGELSEVHFFGDLNIINEFLLGKATAFNSIEADWMPRINMTHGNSSIIDLINFNDSITKDHTNYLERHGLKLPKWYKAFEGQRLKYLNAHFKLNSLFYRKVMLDKIDSIPEKFLEKTIGSLAINNKNMLGNMRYMYFLSDYIGYSSDPLFKTEMPSSQDEWIKFYTKQIEIIEHNLTGDVKDVYTAFLLGNIIERRSYIFQKDWLSLVDNEKLATYLKNYLSSNPILPKGSEWPYFYLPDTSNSNFEPAQFLGKIVLVNFWATWCKPCIKEFPNENDLIDKFQNEPVDVINICIDSHPDKWKELVQQHNLRTINLLSEKAWNDKLKKDYGIDALPHSILIDWKGKVVQNKCPSASEGIDMLISQLLSDMKEEVNNSND